MQTYQPIIDRLTEGQRIRLLTHFNSLSDPELVELGVPSATIETLPSVMGPARISPRALARSWNPTAVSAAVAALCREADGIQRVTIPGAKAAIGAVGASLSEDPLLSGDIATALALGVRDAERNACIEGYGLRCPDAPHAPVWATHPHLPPDERTVREHLIAPFTSVLSSAPCLGILVEADMAVPAAWREMSHLRILRRQASDADTVKALERGEILLEGSAVALQNALYAHRRMRRELEHGQTTMEQFNAAVAAGEAISESTVTEALERLFAFVDACRQPPAPTEHIEHAAETPPAITATPSIDPFDALFDGATVLLDNRDRTLPLKKKTKFCLVGAPACACTKVSKLNELYRSHGCACLGYAPGYEPSLDRSEARTEAAVELAQRADVTLLFLSADGHPTGGRHGMPANRVALFDRLSRLGKRLVVILDAEDTPDIRWLRYAAVPPAAVLMAPLRLCVQGTPVGAAYTVETLFGVRTPAGRLTTTLVDPADPATRRNRFSDGPFLGYRYYDTIRADVHYPFGHGLTYTRFSYGAVSIEEDRLIFTIKNVGKHPGTAVPQVYIGMDASAVLRPRKELVGYAAVRLAPGESSTVRLPLSPRPILTADGALYEAGAYTVYIGESVTDIRAIHHVSFSGSAVPPDGARLEDYLPTIPNIFTEHYTLEAEYTPMKSSLRNPLFGIAALILAALTEVIGMVVDADALYPDIIAAVLAVGAIVFLILELVDRKRLRAREQKQLDEINDILYADARRIVAPRAEELFVELPDADKIAEPVQTHQTASTGEYDHFADVDPTLTFSVAAEELSRLATEKGILLDRATADSLLAALSSTRLVVVKGMDNARFRSLVSVLCAYMGCPVCVDAVDKSYVSESAAVLGEATTGRRGLYTAIMDAQDRARRLHIAALTDVTWADISNYFVPFARYARAPFSACHLSLQDSDGHAVSYHLPKNLWFMLNLKEGESLADIPDYIADIATVHSLPAFESTTPAGSCSEFRPFYYGQMIYLSEKLRASFALDEDVWKQIDRLEAFIARHSEFHIGNKLRLGMEAYLSVLAAAGRDIPDALDETLAVKLMPAAIRALAGKLSRDDQGLGEALDVFLGEDRTAICRKTIKESGADIL